ncbi:MAG: 2-hydroxyacid dehydrogenase [Gammaproteobacteria bacterium]|nr:2-hydroxyacid dehydrogenase [Gammaproteobacteria bacterium]
MKITVFSSQAHDRQFLASANADSHQLVFRSERLVPGTATLAAGSDAVCVFVNDDLGRETLGTLKEAGVKYIALRCAGFNNLDLAAARELDLPVARVPRYSPHAVAEHAIGLMLALDRKYHRAWNRVREGNFSLQGLLGFDLHGKTVGLVGTGNIGSVAARILLGFGCRVLAVDPVRSDALEEAGVKYVPLQDLYARSDIISLHCPLTPATHHLVNAKAIAAMKRGVMLINTSRGAVIDSRALIDGLKSGQLGYLGLDVYEEESELFFEDHSADAIQDDLFMRLTTFPQVLITGHQGFYTREAMTAIASTTLSNLEDLAAGRECENLVG